MLINSAFEPADSRTGLKQSSIMSHFNPPVFARIFKITFSSAHAACHRTSKMASEICLPLATLLALTGCAGLQVKLGMKRRTYFRHL